MIAAWQALTAELDLWAAEGRIAHFWWRDDDAVQATPPLDRLLILHQTTGAPLALAIIPAQIQLSLAARLKGLEGVAALQHGYAHHNHAAVTEKKSEFPTSRPLTDRVADLRTGWALMRQHFGPSLVPVFVPPWNRLASDTLPEMAGLSYAAISGFTPRQRYWAAPGLAWLNTHIDPIDWHGNDNTGAAMRSLAAASGLLRAMRQGELPIQPVGLLTHHLRHDETIWDFIGVFLTTTVRHAAARWIGPRHALAVGAPVDDPGSPAAVTPTS